MQVLPTILFLFALSLLSFLTANSLSGTKPLPDRLPGQTGWLEPTRVKLELTRHLESRARIGSFGKARQERFMTFSAAIIPLNGLRHNGIAASPEAARCISVSPQLSMSVPTLRPGRLGR